MQRTTRRTGRMLGTAIVAGATMCAALSVSPASADTAHRITVIASHLNNPRGVAFDNGHVYVVEAGLGAGNETTGVQVGVGFNGAVTQIDNPTGTTPVQHRIARRLASAAADQGNGPSALGPDGVAASGGRVWAVLGAGGVPGTQLGDLVRIANGTATTLAKVGDFSLRWTGEHANDPWAPAGQFPDGNPYGVLVTNGHTYVVDAAANTLDDVWADGSVHVLAYFPNTAVSDAVPTCVTKGPDGALYIGTLALLDFFTMGPGHSTVYRVNPADVRVGNLQRVLSIAKPWATGFSTITGCTFDSRGNFYAAEMFTGDVQVASFAHPDSGRRFLGQGALTMPNGIAVDNAGHAYVSVFSDSQQANQGKVVRIQL